MIVLVDTSIWSLALRRRSEDLSSMEKALVEDWAELVRRGDASLIGPIRQEILSGVRRERDFETLRERLSAFDDLPVLTADYEETARFFNRCLSRGLTGTPIDLLICAVLKRLDLEIFTVDRDFQGYAAHLGIRLHRP